MMLRACTVSGNGISAPVLIRKQEPEYTLRPRGAKIEGAVVLDVVIMPDRTLDSLKIVRGLDPRQLNACGLGVSGQH
jgi:hypothetical protein